MDAGSGRAGGRDLSAQHEARQLSLIHVYTHDSIGVDEDGPTHQPIEHLASIRAMPGVIDLRPADANEVARRGGC